jgi:hypothetical protein
MDLETCPPGFSSAPVTMTWADVGKTQDLTFYGAIFALHQHPDGTFEPRTGWAVVDRPLEKRQVESECIRW